MDAIKIIGTPLYQWELGRRVYIPTNEHAIINRVEFSQSGNQETLLVEPREKDEGLVVDIPNILLQSGDHIKMFLSYKDENSLETVSVNILPVTRRPKPADYIYEETEVRSIEKIIEDALREAKDSGEFNGEKGDPFTFDDFTEEQVNTLKTDILNAVLEAYPNGDEMYFGSEV